MLLYLSLNDARKPCDTTKVIICNIGNKYFRFDYQMILGIESRGMEKARRLQFRESEMTHAMVFTACNVEVISTIITR